MVEDRYSGLFKLEHTQPGFVTEMLAALTVRYPTVPIHFAETRPLAEEWTSGSSAPRSHTTKPNRHRPRAPERPPRSVLGDADANFARHVAQRSAGKHGPLGTRGEHVARRAADRRS